MNCPMKFIDGVNQKSENFSVFVVMKDASRKVNRSEDDDMTMRKIKTMKDKLIWKLILKKLNIIVLLLGLLAVIGMGQLVSFLRHESD